MQIKKIYPPVTADKTAEIDVFNAAVISSFLQRVIPALLRPFIKSSILFLKKLPLTKQNMPFNKAIGKWLLSWLIFD
jgi:hypothetical protein